MATYVNHLNFLSTYFTFQPSTVPVSEEKLQPILVSTTPNIRDFFRYVSYLFPKTFGNWQISEYLCTQN